MVRFLKLLLSSLVLVSFTSCSSIPTLYKVGKIAAPSVVEDKSKLETLGKVDEVVGTVNGALTAPK